MHWPPIGLIGVYKACHHTTEFFPLLPPSSSDLASSIHFAQHCRTPAPTSHHNATNCENIPSNLERVRALLIVYRLSRKIASPLSRMLRSRITNTSCTNSSKANSSWTKRAKGTTTSSSQMSLKQSAAMPLTTSDTNCLWRREGKRNCCLSLGGQMMPGSRSVVNCIPRCRAEN